MEDGADESERFNEEEKDDSSGEDNPSSDVASLSCLPSFDYSERPPPYLEIEEIPSYRWLESHSSFSRSEPDEGISPRKSASSTSPSVASISSHTSKPRKNPSSFRWNWWLSPAVRKERNTSLTSLQEDNLIGIYQFTFKEIRTATNDFQNIIGQGGFATTFKGFLPHHNQIAVKLPHPDELRNTTHVSSRLRHRNIASFLGYCKHKDKFMLIYEYQPNGSLDRFLFSEGEGETLLNWRIRYKICLQTANGLAYLHNERIIHSDIKPWNILLDADFVPKIDDFYLAKRMSENITHLSTSRVCGTMGYLPPEYYVTGQLTDKTDVFSYGVVILNIVSGKLAFDETYQSPHVDKLHETLKEQGNLLEFVDPRLGSYDEEEALTLLKLSALCTKKLSNLRPSIHTLVSVLEGKLKVEELIHDPWQDDYEQEFPCFSEEEMHDVETNVDVCTAPPTSEVDTMIPGKENDVMQQTSPSLTSTTGDATLESIKNTSEDYDDFHHHTDDIDTLFLAIDSTRIPDGTNELGETTCSFPTVKVPEAFDELKTLVLSTTLKEALNDETKSKIFHLCEVLDDSILSKSQSSLVHHIKYILSFTSELSVAEIEDTLYVKKYKSAQLKVEETKEKAKGLRHEATNLRTSKTSTENHINLIKDKITKHEEELAKLHHELNALKIQHVDDEKKLEEIHKVVASDAREITQLAKWLGEESVKKVSTEDRLKHIRECFDQEQEEWKRIQVRFW